MSSEINHEKLAELTGYKSGAAIEKCLAKQGIKVFRGKDDRVFTFREFFTQPVNSGTFGGPIEFE